MPRHGGDEAALPSSSISWGTEEVEQWARRFCPEAVDSLRLEAVDGETLHGFVSRRDVKESLGVPLGTAQKLWSFVEQLQTAAPGEAGGAYSNGGSGRSGSRSRRVRDRIVENTHEEHFPYRQGEKGEGEISEKSYFPTIAAEGRPAGKDKTIVVCVPMYNEEKFGLENTITSLSNMVLSPSYIMDVLILMDGVNPFPDKGDQDLPSKSARDLLKDWFDVAWEGWNEGGDKKQTTIYENTRIFGGDKIGFTAQEVGSDRGGGSNAELNRAAMRLTLLIKRRNHRKHNSHEWFMKAFAKELNASYVFCTDCATTFHPAMLDKMVKNLDCNPKTAAVCGRQRVMPVEVQTRGQLQNGGSGDSVYESFWDELCRSPSEWFLRCVQTYDFEADHPVSKAAWDWLGFLPVLPGPCGLYRYKELSERCDKYFEIVNKPSTECGLWLANLKIAEDRIPSMLAVFPWDALKLSADMRPLDTPFKTRWVRDAVFYFESETTLKQLVLQRRRWLNGTMAGYVFLAQNSCGIIWSSSHTWMMKLATCFMIYMQLLQVFVLSLGPGIFASILFGTTRFLAMPAVNATSIDDGSMGGSGSGTLADETPLPPVCEWQLDGMVSVGKQPMGWALENLLPSAVTAVYLLAYLIFLIVHRRTAATPYTGWAWKMVILMNVATTCLFIYALVRQEKQLVEVEHNAWDEIKRFLSFDDSSETSDPSANRCVPKHGWDQAIKHCGAADDYDACPDGHDADCEPGYSCLRQVCISPDALTDFARCGKTFEAADISCSNTCNSNKDCDVQRHEVCWPNVRAPQGCTARFMGVFLMVAYVLIPVFFALIDAPVTGELRAVTLMLQSGPAYIIFMPTFVAFFSAYSLNRLADVSWGNRAEGNEAEANERWMKCSANCIAVIVPLLNLAFAAFICVLRVCEFDDIVQYVAWGIMGVAGYTFAIALCATFSRLLAKLIWVMGCGGKSDGQLQLGGRNMFVTEALPNRTEIAASLARTVSFGHSVRQRLTNMSFEGLSFSTNSPATGSRLPAIDSERLLTGSLLSEPEPEPESELMGITRSSSPAV